MSAEKKIKMIILDKDLQKKDIAAKLGMSAQVFYNKLYRKNMSYNYAEKIADILNCDIMFVDRDTGKMY